MLPSKVFVIAEAGVNHNGDLDTAYRLIDAAKQAQADAVKFQFFSSEKLWGDARIAHLELDEADILDVAAYCDETGIEFMCTPFGVEEVEFIYPLVKRLKIASGFVTRKPVLQAARKADLPVILSTGMSTYPEIKAALAVLGRERTTLLHCTSAYPCPLDQVNLRAMDAMKHFGCPVGYSDHTEGILTATAAVALGAIVIEKHLTLDKTSIGPDHRSSTEPSEFARMIAQIRLIELILGEREKCVQPAEMPTYQQWRTQ